MDNSDHVQDDEELYRSVRGKLEDKSRLRQGDYQNIYIPFMPPSSRLVLLGRR